MDRKDPRRQRPRQEMPPHEVPSREVPPQDQPRPWGRRSQDRPNPWDRHRHKMPPDMHPYVRERLHLHEAYRNKFWMKHRRPPRHWFFMKILSLLLCIGLAFIVVQFLSGGSFTAGKIPHYLGWTFAILIAASFILRRMFGPLRMLMKGVNEISNGNLDFQFPIGKHHHGEIYYLAESFNLMVRRVKEMVNSKDQLLLDVSHELRSPLTRMKVALEMMPKNPLRVSLLQDIGEMETMLAEILETQRLKGENGKLVLAPVDLTALARAMARKYKTRKPGVILVGSPAALTVPADEDRVKTVLQNVLENALKYSARQNKTVRVSLEETEHSVLVRVEDSGAGIPPEDQERVFEPFYRVDKSRTKKTGGYGLGLSLCREIMRAHGGEITLESETGKGTRVVLEFPKEPPVGTE
jgi:signal transduction histidine kinase